MSNPEGVDVPPSQVIIFDEKHSPKKARCAHQLFVFEHRRFLGFYGSNVKPKVWAVTSL